MAEHSHLLRGCFLSLCSAGHWPDSRVHPLLRVVVLQSPCGLLARQVLLLQVLGLWESEDRSVGTLRGETEMSLQLMRRGRGNSERPPPQLLETQG